MKKWTKVFGFTLILFLIFFGIMLVIISKLSNKQDREHLVEINRVIALFNDEEQTFNGSSIILDSIEEKKIDNEFITSIYYYCGKDEKKINEIVNGDIVGNEKYEIRKIGNIYILISYDINNSSYKESLTILMVVYSIIVVAFLISIYLYVKNSILKPFNKLQEMPIELSKGNLDLSIKDNKNKHFGRFIWGLNMLKDNMYMNRKKEYELQKEKKMMILTISHDIKTPLSAINLYVKALEEDEKRTKEFAGKIKKNIILINNFVEDIVKYSKEDIINIEVKNEEFYLTDLINKVVNHYKEKMEIMQTKLKIESFPNPLLFGDKDKLFEAISNILENALKYGDRKNIRMGFFAEDNCEIIKISNSGSDIPNSEINHVFESFWRGKNAIGKEGNGLGLYIAREILRKMDGDIYISKEENLISFNLVIKKV